MKNKKVTIGNVTLKNNVLLAPMAGLTDMAFRFVCKKSGAGLTETEMVSCKALFYDNEKTKELLKFSSIEKPKAVQIFGHEPEIFESVLSSGVLKDFDIIDINMGCPAPKIFNNGDGCALMKNAKLACEIIKTAKKCTKQPIMVKFRAGVDEKSVNAIEFAKMCEKAGADAITIHARTREQFYSGHADWNLIKMVKESVKIPVFAN
ncbi:MAG: tRNA-dihydrouridine synthase family protein, partial [Clostridia bacterium]|nr:tRNA-dihydrouridine synthase family protein [Clostridia bacterium]